MRNPWTSILVLALLVAPAFAGDGDETADVGYFNVGVGSVDITPTEAVVLGGAPTPKKTATVGSRLYAKALVISAGTRKVAIVTLDTLKYPHDLATAARKHVEQATGIPAGNVIICSSHTHSGPLWSYYEDKLVTPIGEAVALAVRDLAPCKIGTATGNVAGISENRRVIQDGNAWNRWQLEPAEANRFPAEGPADDQVNVLAVVGNDGRYKAVVFDFACHAATNRAAVISADYPGDVQQYVVRQLGYAVPTLFLAGACGDVNPAYSSVSKEPFAEKLSAEIVRCLGQLEFIDKPALWVETHEIEMPGRESPTFKEAEVLRNWPSQLEHYRQTFDEMKQREKPTYPFSLTGIRIGNDFAIVTNPNELFCQIGLDIKRQSPFKRTMVVEQTNGAHGYVPTAKAFAGGSYETWFGEHSYLTTQAGEIIEQQSLEILKHLHDEP
ncbi:MAG TPA: neutral/alkaline non-lysosomal ceramidase N-terminal domain-containing protein [Pirellulales bacterium]|jgi:hypothetical protein|nr:neutral/alkaline non-lysosomal ceramidase N-terminal domain-containing protein [Pirellulales bacterium]